MPFVTEVRPCGNDKKPLDQTVFGGGKPKAWQGIEASDFPITLRNLSGVSINSGGTNE